MMIKKTKFAREPFLGKENRREELSKRITRLLIVLKIFRINIDEINIDEINIDKVKKVCIGRIGFAEIPYVINVHTKTRFTRLGKVPFLGNNA